MHSFYFYLHTSSKKDIQKKLEKGGNFYEEFDQGIQSENLNASFLLYMFTNVLLLDVYHLKKYLFLWICFDFVAFLNIVEFFLAFCFFI